MKNKVAVAPPAKPRPNPSFVGIPTFGKRPFVADWSQIDADVAV